MRVLAVILLELGFLFMLTGCQGDAPTAADAPTSLTTLSAGAHGADAPSSVRSDRITQEVMRVLPDGSEMQDRSEFRVNHSANGVSAARLDEGRSPIDAPSRGPGSLGRPPAAGGALSINGGMALFDRQGSPIPTHDVDHLRRRAGLPPIATRFTGPGSGAQPAEIPRRSTTRVIDPGAGGDRLAKLRDVTDGEERLSPTRLRLYSTRGDVVNRFIFDETIGEVVETSVERGSVPYLLIHNEYEQVATGFVLTGVTLTRFDPEGRVVARAVQRISPY